MEQVHASVIEWRQGLIRIVLALCVLNETRNYLVELYSIILTEIVFMGIFFLICNFDDQN